MVLDSLFSPLSTLAAILTMFSSLVLTTLLGLAASLPVELESSALAIREPGTLQVLQPRTNGVTYTKSQNFAVYAGGPVFAGPFDPNHISFVMQGDGNFVAYDANHNPVWASNTAGHPGCAQSQTNGACFLYFTGAGDLAVFVDNNVVAWHTNTAGKANSMALMGSAPYIILYNGTN